MFRTIASRLMLWFLLIAAAPCSIVIVLLTRSSSDAMRTLVEGNLREIAGAKGEELEKFAIERLRDANVLAQNPAIIEAAEALVAAQSDPKKRDEMKKKGEGYLGILRSFAEINGYPNIFLLGPNSEMLLTLRLVQNTSPSILKGPLAKTELGALVDRARTFVQTDLSDFQMYPGLEHPAAYAASPILKNGSLVGVVVIEQDNAQVFDVLSDYSGLGKSGEILVGNLSGKSVTIVAPTRHDPAAAFRRHVELGSKQSAAIQRAVQGQRGYGENLDYRGILTMAVWTYLPSFRWGLVVKQDSSEAFAMVNHQRWVALRLLAAALVIVVGAALLAARTLSRPIVAAAHTAQNVASGDLTGDLVVTGRGEIGQLQSAIQKMVSYLRSLLGKIQGSSVALLTTATEIAATARQQEQTMNSFGQSTNQSAAAVKQISATAQELSRTMDEVGRVAADAAQRAASGQRGISEMDGTMKLLAEATASICNRLGVIDERARNINVVVTTITKVADQTNLLSINAAIEAEKAGEAGLGFLVVAREIRRLADQTAVATLDIERMVVQMQQGVHEGVAEMARFSEQVQRGVAEVANIGSQLSEIIVMVQLLTARFDQVSEGMRVQAQGADQIRDAIMQLSEGAAQVVQSLGEFNRATSQMRGAVTSLKEDVSWFTVQKSSEALSAGSSGLIDLSANTGHGSES